MPIKIQRVKAGQVPKDEKGAVKSLTVTLEDGSSQTFSPKQFVFAAYVKEDKGVLVAVSDFSAERFYLSGFLMKKILQMDADVLGKDGVSEAWDKAKEYIDEAIKELSITQPIRGGA